MVEEIFRQKKMGRFEIIWGTILLILCCAGGEDLKAEEDIASEI